jgi:hypothetical protein
VEWLKGIGPEFKPKYLKKKKSLQKWQVIIGIMLSWPKNG